jgi:hypothetical protein
MQMFTDKFTYHPDGYLIHKFGRRSGKKAGSYDKSCGYWRVKVGSKSYLAHRVIYLIHYPNYVGDLDHINRNKLDNRVENLRPCNRPENVVNSRMRSDNTVGYKGVSFHKATGKYQAQTMHFGKRIHIGLFSTPEEAAKAYDKKAQEVFGDFATLNFGNSLERKHDGI